MWLTKHSSGEEMVFGQCLKGMLKSWFMLVLPFLERETTMMIKINTCAVSFFLYFTMYWNFNVPEWQQLNHIGLL